MSKESFTNPDLVDLTTEAQAKEALAQKLHETADVTPPGSPERVAAAEADSEAEGEWEAASAVASAIEGFSGGEAAE